MSADQEQAEIYRGKAKRLLRSALGLGENIGNEAVDMAVDCIIGAAMLEAVMVINQVMQEQAANRVTSDNP